MWIVPSLSRYSGTRQTAETTNLNEQLQERAHAHDPPGRRSPVWARTQEASTAARPGATRHRTQLPRAPTLALSDPELSLPVPPGCYYLPLSISESGVTLAISGPWGALGARPPNRTPDYEDHGLAPVGRSVGRKVGRAAGRAAGW